MAEMYVAHPSLGTKLRTSSVINMWVFPTHIMNTKRVLYQNSRQDGDTIYAKASLKYKLSRAQVHRFAVSSANCNLDLD